ncbi:hypothetical protein HK105_204171 [Polyrhizophydium stewartii]|uniref:Trafficking protein particle complex subunit 6B n=1 Tax=Polyrhizophydium stewartii TaxID=2732419 RepID=A0ABR4NA68_9FUNG|nr:Trafficking protein particle complex subunit 33 [Polyrhizophydium stewartii]
MAAADDKFVAESAWDYLFMEVVSTQRRLFRTETDTEAAYAKLEQLGFRVGYGIAEKATRDRPRFAETIDIIKFVCKDIWISVFKKQVDNLKTNHRGVFVLTDNNFRWLSRMASDAIVGESAKAIITDHLALPCGIIRGVLANLGIPSLVVAEFTTLPQCTFQIRLNPKGGAQSLDH